MRLKELAESLGLSQTTVSRALNGYPEVNENTRRRVVDAAARAGYRPSTRARSLAMGRSMVIGHVIPASSQNEIVNPVFADFIMGASEIYTRESYSMALTFVSDTDEAEAYREMAARQSVDGFILHAPRVSDKRVPLLTDLGLPFVIHGRAGEMEAGYSWVDVNNRRAFEEATQRLVALGHGRIGLINGQTHMDFARRRLEGFRAALDRAGLAADTALEYSGEMSEENGYTAARRMLGVDPRPTAFIASSIISAYGIRRAVEEAGLRLGSDVSLITYDDDLSYIRNGDDRPIFSAMRSSVRLAGRLSASALIDLIRDPARTPRNQMLEAAFVPGPSTGPGPFFGD